MNWPRQPPFSSVLTRKTTPHLPKRDGRQRDETSLFVGHSREHAEEAVFQEEAKKVRLPRLIMRSAVGIYAWLGVEDNVLMGWDVFRERPTETAWNGNPAPSLRCGPFADGAHDIAVSRVSSGRVLTRRPQRGSRCLSYRHLYLDNRRFSVLKIGLLFRHPLSRPTLLHCSSECGPASGSDSTLCFLGNGPTRLCASSLSCPSLLLSKRHRSSASGTYLPSCAACRCGCRNFGGAFSGSTRNHRAETGDLNVNPAFLVLEAHDGRVDNLVREFWRHVIFTFWHESVLPASQRTAVLWYQSYNHHPS
jgi:hypothetical protein